MKNIKVYHVRNPTCDAYTLQGLQLHLSACEIRSEKVERINRECTTSKRPKEELRTKMITILSCYSTQYSSSVPHDVWSNHLQQLWLKVQWNDATYCNFIFVKKAKRTTKLSFEPNTERNTQDSAATYICNQSINQLINYSSSLFFFRRVH